jgi:hypothetical protein
MNKIGVPIENGLKWCRIVTNVTFELLSILFSCHFDFAEQLSLLVVWIFLDNVESGKPNERVNYLPV